MNNRFKTGFLYGSSSFAGGVGSVLNIYGHFHDYNSSHNPDEIAIANDWKMIGQDIRDALENANVAHERKCAA
ncbi:MAG TPA: hypothetical protein VGY56_08135 [Verrucomicrobiae bacterium]|nr:hypothetical protein [Verrucomicrobiae bacterium]